jgi:HAE1 family hydrophobic/amphiphilic exporter-1
VIQVMDNLRARIKEVNENILAPRKWGLELHQVYDQTVYVHQSIDNARTDLIIGGVLALAVLFLTLRSVGATLVVGLSIPVSIIGTFLGMYLTGRNLNVVSMAGLAFAIGMGVDNTIVVLENIFRHREMGKGRLEAALDGTREVWGAIVAATLANIAVFLPVVFIQQEAGQLFRDISIAISISLFLYMAVSPTVIPMLATLFLRKMPGGFVETREGVAEQEATTRLGRLTRPLSRAGASASEFFHHIVYWLTGGLVRRVVLVVVMIGVALVASVLLMPPRTYVPTGNQNLMFAFVVTPPGYNLDELRQMGKRAEGVLSPWWSAKEGSEELKRLQAEWLGRRDKMMVPMLQQMIDGQKAALKQQGLSDGQIEAAVMAFQTKLDAVKNSPAPSSLENFFFVATNAGTFMGATSGDMQNVAPIAYLFEAAGQAEPGTMVIAQQMPIFRLGGFGAGIEINIAGPDIEKVRNAAGAAMGTMMAKYNRFVLSQPQNFNIPRNEVQVFPEKEKAAQAGLTGREVRQISQVTVDGEVIGDYRVGGRAIDLTVKMDSRSEERYSHDLGTAPIATRDGRIIPLATVARFVETSAPQQIDRLEERPAVRLTFYLQPGETVEEMQARLVNEVIEPLRQAGMITPEMTVRYTGSADKLQSFLKEFIGDTSQGIRSWIFSPGIFILAAIITYLLLAALFESWLHPFTIIMSVPFALVGGFIGLRILHTFEPSILLDVLTMLGFVILIGTIVNNPILIVHQALNNMKEGMDRRQAIAHSTQTRVRPIFMSVITSVAGMAPLVVLGGAGSELYRGLGSVVVGGLLVSTVFTLLLTPTLMSLMLDMQSGLRRLWTRPPGGGRGPTPPPSENGDGEVGEIRREPHPRPVEPAMAKWSMPPDPGTRPA